ncbi:hypothetical protein GK047_13500 [Paenibacillus sp. SYP-B3998]|uniref:Uncharacterized protein n=1 Tax=Paenibacillus sp. SYP-B3998 TaxID=2678564 RepID=A0A6G3ZZL9_9BACL|nr:hypothetical protein [Paenibacillus sp. SYP-B3998]NEW07021.1 hypothetical protein [Paenibacillus sp. SYP-B3998]
MKNEDLITPAQLHALLAENGEDFQEFGMDEPMGAQHLISLQKAVVMLTRQVETLQSELHEHFQIQHRQQEQLLRQFKHQIEQQLQQQLTKGLDQETQTGTVEECEERNPAIEPQELRADATLEEEPITYSRVKSYSKIRKRRKTFLEKLFE